MIGGLKKVNWVHKTKCDNCRLASETFEPDIKRLIRANGARWISVNVASSQSFTRIDGTERVTKSYRYENNPGWIYDIREQFQTPAMILTGDESTEFIDIVPEVILPDKHDPVTHLDEAEDRVDIFYDRLPRIKRDLMLKIFRFAVRTSDYAPAAKDQLLTSGKAPENLLPNYEQGKFKRDAWDDALWKLKRFNRRVYPA